MNTQPLLKAQIIYIASFFLAFCSLVYELLLGQAMSISFGSTNQSYIYVIGCYLFGMGIGAWMADRANHKLNPLQTLIRVEIVLISLFLAGFYFILLAPGFFDFSRNISFLAAHAFGLVFCFGVGIATGYEIPLLLQMLPAENSARTLAWDYIGGFAASFLFIFLIPGLGLVRVAQLAPFINLATVFMMLQQHAPLSIKTAVAMGLALAFLIVSFVCADAIEIWIRVFLFF